jgi:hypothetical protein
MIGSRAEHGIIPRALKIILSKNPGVIFIKFYEVGCDGKKDLLVTTRIIKDNENLIFDPPVTTGQNGNDFYEVGFNCYAKILKIKF